MQLVALLVVVLIAGMVVVGRLGPGSPLSPARNAPPPTETLQQVGKQVEAAGQAEQQRLKDALEQPR